jgi:mono/diheme cytochrome c family protein
VACSSCHAVDGGGNKQSGFPRLAGLKPVSHAQAPAGIPVSAGEKLANYGDMTTRGPERVSQGGPGLNYVPDL